MGATVSQCVPACCSCCLSSHAGGHKGATTKARTSTASTRTRDGHDDDDDETDSWLHKGKVPLLSARHDQEIVVDDCSVVVRKVAVMRTPTQTKAQTKTQTNTEQRAPKHGASQHAGGSPRRGLRAVSASTDQRRVAAESPSERRSLQQQSDHDVDDSPNSSNEDGSWELASPVRGSGDAGASSPHTRSQRSLSAVSHESRSSVHDDDDVGDDGGDGNGDEETKTGSHPRSPRSSGSASSSPKRKTRYGRKNYRADSSRKKTL